MILFGIITLLPLMVFCASHPPDEMTINQAIAESATSGASLDFIQGNRTLMVEFDMLMSLDDWEDYHARKNGNNGRQKRKGIRGNRWSRNTIPYDRIPFSGRDAQAIQQSFDAYHRYTCIRFEQSRGNEQGKIYFTDGGGCSSYVGMLGGRQPVTLARGCRSVATIIHELGHAVGLHHEQTRPDRDGFVDIEWRNMQQTMKFNFEKNDVDALGVPYDYLSIMHYDEMSFSTNGRPTIMAKDSQYQSKMGRSKGFSFADVKIINLMYKCGGHCGNKNCPHPGFMSKDCKCMCPGNPVQECSGGGGGGGGGGVNPGGGRTGGGEGCTDSQRDCSDWARSGHCDSSKYGYFMRMNCQKSCKLCGQRSSFSKGKSGCIDTFAKCPEWAKRGDCKTNPTTMNDACAKSCGNCKGGRTSFSRKTACEDAKPECASMAKSGMCEQNRSYMRETCAKSCHPRCRKD